MVTNAPYCVFFAMMLAKKDTAEKNGEIIEAAYRIKCFKRNLSTVMKQYNLSNACSIPTVLLNAVNHKTADLHVDKYDLCYIKMSVFCQ